METVSYLTDVYGPRLTGSPIIKEAADWALKTMQEWGLANVHLETLAVRTRLAERTVRRDGDESRACPAHWFPDGVDVREQMARSLVKRCWQRFNLNGTSKHGEADCEASSF